MTYSRSLSSSSEAGSGRRRSIFSIQPLRLGMGSPMGSPMAVVLRLGF
jgi:hypothetical protein